jgi:hypothetical protein
MKEIGADRDGQDAVYSIEQLARVKNKGPKKKKENPRTFTQKDVNFD